MFTPFSRPLHFLNLQILLHTENQFSQTRIASSPGYFHRRLVWIFFPEANINLTELCSQTKKRWRFCDSKVFQKSFKSCFLFSGNVLTVPFSSALLNRLTGRARSFTFFYLLPSWISHSLSLPPSHPVSVPFRRTLNHFIFQYKPELSKKNPTNKITKRFFKDVVEFH